MYTILDERIGVSAYLILISGSLALTLACTGAPSSDTPPPTTEPVAVEDSGPVKLDMDQIFPPGPGRDLVLNNCQTCHVFTPIVILQMDETQWARNGSEHRDRVELVSDEDFDLMYKYLATTFNPDRPVPELPEALLEAWTSY